MLVLAFQKPHQKSSDYPAIAVSDDYRQRILHDIDIDGDALITIPPGIPAADDADLSYSFKELKKLMPELEADTPILAYFGRADAEKGLDLFLYAAALLRKKDIDFQLIVAGPYMYGPAYMRACKDISARLRLPTIWSDTLSDELRSCLYALSHCVVCPSIQREPFGMVAIEAMSYGTPAVVPDYGGVAGVVEVDGLQGGIKFDVWDSGSLADALEKLLKDRDLWQRLCDNGPKVAEYFSVPRLADRVLDHLGIVRQSLANRADEALNSERFNSEAGHGA